MIFFADEFFYVALLNRHDEYHARVIEWVKNFTGNIVTTQWVLTEVADAFAGSQMRRNLRSFFSKLENNPYTKIVASSPEYFMRRVALYDERPDKEWPLTDCISFVVMADEELKDALTGDRHFQQAGFTPVFV